MPTSLQNQYVIGLGSNLGDRQAMLAQACAGIAADVGEILRIASSHATAPMGAADQPFLNSAVLVASPLGPSDVMRRLLTIEARLGRVRTVKWGNRTIDLDLLLWLPSSGVPTSFADAVVTIPHPHLLDRDFALVPAAEVAGEWVHPISGRTLRDEVGARGYGLS